MREKYVNECKQIQQNCTYSAETHHLMAIGHRRMALWLQLIPAVIAAVSSALVAAQITPLQLLWLTVLASATAAVANVLDPNRSYQDHLNAAKNFTALKHDARSLHEAFGRRMPDELFATAVENLHDKYNSLVRMVPPTSNRSFQKARKNIEKGVHLHDRDFGGDLKV